MQDQEESALATQRAEPRDNGIEQLREILFGAVVDDLERKIARTDSQHAARENELKHEARRRLEIIESHLKKELELLSARVEREAAQTQDTLRSLTRMHRENAEALEQRIATLEDTIGKMQRQLHEDVLEQAKTFLDEMQELRLELTTTLERRIRMIEGELEASDDSAES